MDCSISIVNEALGLAMNHIRNNQHAIMCDQSTLPDDRLRAILELEQAYTELDELFRIRD